MTLGTLRAALFPHISTSQKFGHTGTVYELTKLTHKIKNLLATHEGLNLISNFTHSPSSLTISARMAGVDLAFLFSSTGHKQKTACFK